ncbi:HBS1-like protein [Bienertia sinuspersici]
MQRAEALVNQNTVKLGLWRCSICTYDNDESMTCCDICGVLRVPPSDGGSGIDKKTVGGTCKDSGVSQLAKSLFAPVPRRSTKMVVASQPQNCCSVIGDGSSCYDIKNVQQHYHVLSDGLSAPRSSRLTTIVPFKFDVPSPDDAISSRLNSSKKGAPPGFHLKNATTATESSARPTDSSVELKRSIPEDHSVASTSNFSRNDIVEGPSTSTKSDNSPVRNSRSNQNSIRETESLTSGLDNMTLNGKSGSSRRVIPKKTLAQYKPEKWMLPEKEDGVMAQLNLAIKQMHKFEKESKQQGKGSFAYAWALDESAEERDRGITMTVAVAYFDTKKYHVVVLDSPGHKDFVPNMIAGATQADAAILVIDASIGAYETGMDSTGGQSREHAQLIRSFGVEQVIVAINKMDVVGYTKERFELIKRQVGPFLRQCGFKESSISWVPLSAMENQNLVASASDVRLNSWYKGPYLLDAIDTLHPPRRDYEKPLIMPICDVVKAHSMAQVSACGKLEAGALRSGCKSGENIAVVLQGIDVNNVIAGGVLCHPDFPVRVASHLELKILVLDVKVPILIGSQLEFHIHHAKEAARVSRIVSLLDPKTGKETKKAPRCLLANQRAVIEIALQGEVCVEDYTSFKALGRVSLRSSGRTIALGVVTQVIEDQKVV